MAKKKTSAETAESMARKQREISVSEFFLKNRHLLGFDNPRKALLTTVKEAVDNSLDACEEAGIVPEIWVHIESTANNRYKIGIQDNGPGISQKAASQLFEPFFTTRNEGTGLGLYIARQLSEANRIRLEYQALPGGSCFRLSFPNPKRPKAQ